MTNSQNELKVIISAFFYDPVRDRDKYKFAFQKSILEKNTTLGNVIPYSPLYYMRRELLFLMGKIAKPMCDSTNEVEFLPIFSAILVINATIEGLVSDLYGIDRSSLGRPDFAQCPTCNDESQVKKKKQSTSKQQSPRELLDQEVMKFKVNYMGLNGEEAQILTRLRNSLAHNFYKLTDFSQSGKKVYFELNEEKEGKIAENQFSKGSKEDTFLIRPFIIYDSFEKGISKLENQVMNLDSDERKLFEKNINPDTWTAVY